MSTDRTHSKRERKLLEKDIEQATDQIAEVFRSYGVHSGDAIGVCLPEISEREITRIACKKLGAVEVFFEIEKLNLSSLAESMRAANVRVLIIADWCLIGKRLIPSKTIGDRASVITPTLEYIVVVRHLDHSISWLDGRDVQWDALFSNET